MAGNLLTSWVTVSFWRRVLLHGVIYVFPITTPRNLSTLSLHCINTVNHMKPP